MLPTTRLSGTLWSSTVRQAGSWEAGVMGLDLDTPKSAFVNGQAALRSLVRQAANTAEISLPL